MYEMQSTNFYQYKSHLNVPCKIYCKKIFANTEYWCSICIAVTIIKDIIQYLTC